MKILNKSLLYEILKDNCIFIVYPKLGMHGASVPGELDKECAMTGCSAQLSGYKKLIDEFLKLGFKVYAVGTIELKKQEAFAASVGESAVEFISDEDFLLEREFGAAAFVTNSGFKFYFRQNLIFCDKKLIFNQMVKDVENDARNTLEYVKKI
ncbi:hypothetical protein [Campylobacter sp. 19-13652]|uniref:hypothetical protein n=1 Tax=Campylobacter sp. 19-13652 TaxID=2840180 RepID=UPI001C791F97|nr:hypothetical protein [Campylobacter sp. 19-13652]BCX80170.1 hypothetical protein LBC_16320 [Campylobacter sp. 19-13652]